MLYIWTQVLQQQQQSRIRELERELMALRGRHTETIQQLKKAFLHEKHECQADADKKISEMSKQANQVAYVYFNEVSLTTMKSLVYQVPIGRLCLSITSVML